MRLFQIDDLRALAEQEQWPCVSLYLPTHRAGRKETQEDPIRLKNAVAEAKEQLAKADVRGYVNIVCKRLEKYLDGQTAPLILAAVAYEQSFYRQANSYHSLLEEGIVGNPDGWDDDALHQAAWEIVEPHFAEGRKISLKHFADLSHTDKATDKLEEILPAACHGRVRTLFIQTQARTWGKFDAAQPAVEIHDSRAPKDVDLIDLATVCVLQNKGMIYALPQNQMPTDSSVAAFFRY